MTNRQFRSFKVLDKTSCYTFYHCFSVRGAIPYLVAKDNKSGKIVKCKQYTRKDDLNKLVSSLIDDISMRIDKMKKAESDAVKIRKLLAKHELMMRKQYGVDSKSLPSGVCIRSGGTTMKIHE